MDEQISEILRQMSIKEYLEARGVVLLRCGKKWKCKCPLPGHEDDSDPSFYVTTMPSGVEVFKCWGCGSGGSLITLIHLIENVKKGEVINRLSAKTGIKISQLVGLRTEPLPKDIMEVFCDEDDVADEVANHVVGMLAERPLPDAVERVSRLYLRMDELCDLGDKEGMAEIRNRIADITSAYCEGGKNDGKKKGKQEVEGRTG
jgi:hypothetical protein